MKGKSMNHSTLEENASQPALATTQVPPKTAPTGPEEPGSPFNAPSTGQILNPPAVTKGEIVAMVQRLTERDRRIPTRAELHRSTGLKWRTIGKLFGSYRELLVLAGFEASGPGWELGAQQLFRDWAEVVRKVGRVPTQQEYDQLSRYSLRPMMRRCKSWYAVPRRMLEFAQTIEDASQWEDVLMLARDYTSHLSGQARTSERLKALRSESGLVRGRPVYGHPLMMAALANAPTNELGVVFLFGVLAERLGFQVLRLQAEFPDCEALRRTENDRWQRVAIEFEFESRNFLIHGHDERQCDLIVCWKHNWEDCPINVLELSTMVG